MMFTPRRFVCSVSDITPPYPAAIAAWTARRQADRRRSRVASSMTGSNRRSSAHWRAKPSGPGNIPAWWPASQAAPRPSAHSRAKATATPAIMIEAASGVSTGISAHDRARTVRTAVDPASGPDDLVQPGHVFPLMAEDGGVLVRAGHTEAGVDYMRMAGLDPSAVIVEIMAEDGTMARRPELERFAARHGLKMGSIADLIRHRLQHESSIDRVLERAVDTLYGPFRLVVYRDRIEGGTHYALLHGSPGPDDVVLTRVHVQTPLSDLLHLRDDGVSVPLHQAFARVAKAPHGCLLILAAPGGGDALAALTGGTGDDADLLGQWRRTGLGAQILADLGLRRLHLLGTPRAYPALAGFGIEVVDFAAP